MVLAANGREQMEKLCFLGESKPVKDVPTSRWFFLVQRDSQSVHFVTSVVKSIKWVWDTNMQYTQVNFRESCSKTICFFLFWELVEMFP